MSIPELREKLRSGGDMILLDVRSEKEFKEGHINGAVLMPIDDLRKSLDKIDKKRQIILYCKTGYRAYLGFRILKNSGFLKIYLLNGSYLSWTREI